MWTGQITQPARWQCEPHTHTHTYKTSHPKPSFVVYLPVMQSWYPLGANRKSFLSCKLLMFQLMWFSVQFLCGMIWERSKWNGKWPSNFIKQTSVNYSEWNKSRSPQDKCIVEANWRPTFKGLVGASIAAPLRANGLNFLASIIICMMTLTYFSPELKREN